MSGAVLKKYTTIIDFNTFNSVLTDDIIEQLYVMNNKCFPKLPEKSKEHYYLRLINFIHHDIKYYRSSSRSPKSSSSSSSSDSKVIIQENLYGKLFTTFNACDEYCKKNRYELYVMYADSTLSTVVSSCLVHYNDISGLARTKEICVGVPNKKYCKEMLLQVIEEIKKEQTIIQISIYCDKNNPAACKCYNSVFNSKDTSSNTKITETDDKYTFLYTLPRARVSDDISQLQVKKSKLKKSK
jgi:hypothetical protein